MENKTLKRVGIALAAALVLVIIAVNMMGTGDKGIVTKAFRDAFNEERAITESVSSSFPKEKALKDALSKNSETSVTGNVVSAGKTDNRILNAILQRASFDGSFKKDMENKLSHNTITVKFNDKNLFLADIFTSPEGLALSFPEVSEESCLYSDSRISYLTEACTMDMGHIEEIGNRAAEYFLTLLKFGTYERTESGSVIFTVADERLDTALDFVKSLIGERLANSESFPIDVDSLAVNSLKAEIVLNEDDSLNNSVAACEISYALKETPGEIKTAAFGVGFNRIEGLNVLANVRFSDETTLGAAVARSEEENEYNLETSFFVLGPDESRTVKLNTSLYNGKDVDRTVSLSLIAGDGNSNQGFELRKSDVVSVNEDGTISLTSPDAEILRIDSNAASPVLKLEMKQDIKPLAEAVEVPEGREISSMTEEEIKTLKAEIAKNITSNSFTALFGK